MSQIVAPYKHQTLAAGFRGLISQGIHSLHRRMDCGHSPHGFSWVLGVALLAVCAAAPPRAGGTKTPSASNRPPRKVIVGTVMKGFWVDYPGLSKRLAELDQIVDQMDAESKQKYGRGLDIAILPEVAVTGEIHGNIVEHSVPFEGQVKEAFAGKARQHHCYIVVPLFMLEDKAKGICSNAAILVGRKGEVVGTYRKLHLAVDSGSDSMEGGMTPGKEVPVFDCDFGKVGMQICFDMNFDYGWQELSRKGAELVAWPTQSPQTGQPAARAREQGYYIVSSTWRNNASVFEPTGKICAQIREPKEILVQEIDLSYAILPWSSELQNGAALKKKYGNKVGYHYYEDEDCGIFWSNDPKTSIQQMIRPLGLNEMDDELNRVQKLFRKAGVPE